MTFKYRTSRTRRLARTGTKPQLAKEDEELTGFVQGKRATEPEERWYRAALKNRAILQTTFQINMGSPGLQGQRQLDFLHRTVFGWRAVEVDGAAFVHKGESKRARDRLRDIQRIEGLRKMSIRVLEIEHVTDDRLQTQADSDKRAKEVFG